MKGLPGYCLTVFFAFVIILSRLKLSNSDRIQTKIYRNLENEYNCFRRLNDTDQIGCNSDESGSVGIVYIINGDRDLDYVLNTGTNYPYVAVISTKYFNFETLIQMKSKSERIGGVLVLDKEVSRLESYSPEKSCPNDNFDLFTNNQSYSHCQKQKWNIVLNRNNDKVNENIMFNDWPFPIYLIRNHKSVKELENCFQTFNKEWPLCAVQLTTSSYAAKDAKTCMRRSFLKNNPINFLDHAFVKTGKFCTPLKAYNMFSSLLTTTMNTSINEKSIVVLSAKLDSFSMFSGVSPGADSVITSLVTFLVIVHTLSQKNIKNMIQIRAPERNVLFALFDGESFDYIGSSRAVYDMNLAKFPVDPDSKYNPDMAQIQTKHFSHFIELNQLALREKSQILYLHKNLHSNPLSNEIEQIIRTHAKDVSNLTFESSIEDIPVPPSSLQSFLKEDNSLIGIVIANHQKEYTNRFYNSLYDNFEKLDIDESKLAKSLTNIATVISKSIFDLLTKSSNLTQNNETDRPNITSNEELTKSLLNCYLINSDCSLFNTVITAKNNPNVTFETYVGSKYHSVFSRYTFMLLSYFNSEEVSVENRIDCYNDTKQDKRFDYSWIPGPTLEGLCIRSHSTLHSGVSPAFVDYKTQGISNSNLYSTWTQTVPKDTFVRMFLRVSPFQQRLTLLSGIAILMISTIIIIFVKLRAKILFNLEETQTTSLREEFPIEPIKSQ